MRHRADSDVLERHHRCERARCSRGTAWNLASAGSRPDAGGRDVAPNHTYGGRIVVAVEWGDGDGQLIAMLRGRRRSPLVRDAGFTLSEMLVGIVVLGLIMTALTSLMIVTQRTSGRNGSYLADTDQGRNAISAVAKNLRTAVLPSQLLSF